MGGLRLGGTGLPGSEPSSPAPPLPSSPPLLAHTPSPHPGLPQRSLGGLGTQTPACLRGWLWATPSAQQASTRPGPAGIEGLGERAQGHRLMSRRSPSPSARAAGAPTPGSQDPRSGLTGPSPQAHGASRAHRNPLDSQDHPLDSRDPLLRLIAPPQAHRTPWAHRTLPGLTGHPWVHRTPRAHGTSPGLMGPAGFTGPTGLTGLPPPRWAHGAPWAHRTPLGSQDSPWAHRARRAHRTVHPPGSVPGPASEHMVI